MSNIYATVAIAVPAIAIPSVVVTADLATTAAAIGLVKLKTAAILAATRSRRSPIAEVIKINFYQIHNCLSLLVE